jgi:hypothetical protein
MPSGCYLRRFQILRSRFFDACKAENNQSADKAPSRTMIAALSVSGASEHHVENYPLPVEMMRSHINLF